jgi:LVIVD repeat
MFSSLAGCFLRPAWLKPRTIGMGFLLALAISAFGGTDHAQAASACVPGKGDQPETGLQGDVPNSARMAPNGFQGFWCGMNKVGQNTLFNRGTYGATAIWGPCAYSSIRNPSDPTLPTTGVYVLDVSVPSNPTTGVLLRSPAMLQAYEGLRAQSGFLLGSGQQLPDVDVFDVSQDCLHPDFKSTRTTPAFAGLHEVQDNHGGWLHYDGKTFWGVPFIGNNILLEPTRVDVHAIGFDDPAHPVDLINWNRLQLPPAIRDKVASTANFHDVTTNFDGTRIYMALYGQGSCANGMMILDSSDIAKRRPHPVLKYVKWFSWCDQPTQAYGDGSTANAHTTQYVVHKNGKPYIITTDEGPALFQVNANGNCLQRTYSRLIDISDEQNPKIVATWNPQVNDAATCAIGAADQQTYYPHYIGVNSKSSMTEVFYAAYWSGVRVVDFSDPEHPKEVAYYNSPRNPALTPVTASDHSAPPIPYDEANCFLYTGWTDNGLIILEVTDPKHNPCLRKAATGGGTIAGAAPASSDNDNDKGNGHDNGKGNNGHDNGNGHGNGNGHNADIQFSLNAKRVDRGFGHLEGNLELNDEANRTSIRVTDLVSLGSVRNQCGTVSVGANAVEFSGDGQFNGKHASFRVCVQDNGEWDGGPEHIALADQDDQHHPNAIDWIDARWRDHQPHVRKTPDQFFLTCTAGCSYTASGAVDQGNIQVRQQ